MTELCHEVVEDPFEVCHYIDLPLLEGVQHGHQDPPRVGAGIGLRAKADLAGNDGGP